MEKILKQQPGNHIEISEQDGLPLEQRRWAIVAVSIGVAMSSLDTAIANTALPAMASQLQATAADSVWIVNAYQLAMVATLLPFAALGEILGYRRVSIFGLFLFTLASLACACAWNLPTLLVARLFQGVGASAIMGVNTAMLRAIYPARILGRGLGTNALVVAVAFTAGPSVASLILSAWSWPWLFAINVPLGVIALLLARKVLPVTRQAAHKFDALTAIYNVGAFGMLILTIGDAAHLVEWRRLVIEVVVTAAFFILLLRRQGGHQAPMLPVDLFRRPLFALSSLTAVCTFAAQSLAFVSLPFYFQMVLGRSAVETGFLITPWAVLVGIMAPIAGRLSDHYPPGLLGGIGLAVLSGGMVSLILMPENPSTFAICWRMAVCGIGFGFFQAPNLKAIMHSAPPERSGGASGIIATSRLIGQASGAALVAFCFTISSNNGELYALMLGAGFAVAGSIASFSRLFVTPLSFRKP
ncbi:DHA2 family multidrug resistance protein-like MFS transporter [Herminiimonas fonticola]|uniref:DHA2 family multidrug resistance protein-like MFS transporter n=1 Tax=Herminiimonas fonticola TaxID=303380 RepID=A0A4R6GGW5_9BURK|nr:Major Facilitator Superfamily [Herminiimonas fonticola]TDN94201.1 DHA2 family multidrug resistance protein-like MFS transporter [Herminiimonas fonticola]